MFAQSLGEYGAASTLVGAFTNLWVQGKAIVLSINPIWYVVVVVAFFLVRKRH